MAISYQQMQLALRARLLTLQACTTGSVSLSATATGYARASGSFLTDGFRPGMEVAGTGFANAANNAAKTITAVTATKLTCAGTVTEAAGTRTLAVGLPAARAWENVETSTKTGEPFVVEQFVPGGTTQFAAGPGGMMEAQALYSVQVYVPTKYGVGAAHGYIDALMTLFAPRVAMTLTNGDTLRVRADTGPYRGQLISREPGWATVPFTAPLRLYTKNPV